MLVRMHLNDHAISIAHFFVCQMFCQEMNDEKKMDEFFFVTVFSKEKMMVTFHHNGWIIHDTYHAVARCDERKNTRDVVRGRRVSSVVFLL